MIVQRSGLPYLHIIAIASKLHQHITWRCYKRKWKNNVFSNMATSISRFVLQVINKPVV